jgi:multimeric flavodoxin WrbA
MPQLLAVNGSYRENGVIDRAVNTVAETALEAGATVEIIHLRDYPIEFCRNCRECTQVPGEAPGPCVHHDPMHALIEKIEAADGYILASPTNFSSATAIFKRFMERLVVYADWPWGSHAPKFRKKNAQKRALLIASSAAPGLMGRFFYTTLKQLRMTAKTIGAKPVGSVFMGLMSQQQHPELPHRALNRLKTMTRKLL